jgi:hypothetical protein
MLEDDALGKAIGPVKCNPLPLIRAPSLCLYAAITQTLWIIGWINSITELDIVASIAFKKKILNLRAKKSVRQLQCLKSDSTCPSGF